MLQKSQRYASRPESSWIVVHCLTLLSHFPAFLLLGTTSDRGSLFILKKKGGAFCPNYVFLHFLSRDSRTWNFPKFSPYHCLCIQYYMYHSIQYCMYHILWYIQYCILSGNSWTICVIRMQCFCIPNIIFKQTRFRFEAATHLVTKDSLII